MLKCEGCPIDAIHESDEERLKCVCRERCERVYQQGREEAIADLFKALPDCDKIEIEHLITIMEQIKEAK